MDRYDICIVGAGVVGCAIARELMRRSHANPIRVLVLEQHESPGQEASGRNSGVLHSGIHETPFSLKERLAWEGCRAASAYALQRDIPLLRTGMIIAVAREDIRRGLWRDAVMLRRLWFNAWRTNTVVRFMTPSALRSVMPHLQAWCGLAIPSVSVIDAEVFVRSLMNDSESAGVQFAFNNRVTGIEVDASTYLVSTNQQRIRAACVINAAGLFADEVAAYVASSRKYTITPLRGEYYELVDRTKAASINCPVYPALPPQATGKGIHVSPRPNGRLYIGPNEMPIASKTDYTSQQTPPGRFVEALHAFLPDLTERDLRWAYSGIRPRVVTGRQFKSDFIVSVDKEDPLLINLIGIESPGLSAALALARHVCDLPSLRKRFPSGKML